MSLLSRIARWPVFKKIYLAVILYVLCIMVFVVACFALFGQFPEFGWYTPTGITLILIIWIATALVPGLAGGYLLVRYFTARLHALMRASDEFALGNMRARMPVRDDSRNEFDLLARNYNVMAETVERQLEFERRLVAAVSHELRGPLARMSVASDLLQDGRAGLETLPQLTKEIGKMSDLVETLLAQARAKVRESAEKRPLNLGAMLHSIALDYGFLGKAEGKTVRLESEDELIITAHPSLTHRIFDNIIANALRFTPRGKSVDIEARSIGDSVTIAVRDYGPGVPESRLEDIFLAFFRIDDQDSGAGLGLSLAKEATLYHGGAIRAENASPGLRVIVTLPLARGARAGADEGASENGESNETA